MIRPVQAGDAGAICDIYNRYIDDTWITGEMDRCRVLGVVVVVFNPYQI